MNLHSYNFNLSSKSNMHVEISGADRNYHQLHRRTTLDKSIWLNGTDYFASKNLKLIFGASNGFELYQNYDLKHLSFYYSRLKKYLRLNKSSSACRLWVSIEYIITAGI